MLATRSVANRFAAWKRLSRLRKTGIVVLIFAIPNYVSAGTFWRSTFHYFLDWIRFANNSTIGRISLLAIGALLLAVPWKQWFGSKYDLSTLRGRTLKLSEDMRIFLNSIPPASLGGTMIIPGTCIERSVDHSLNVMKLHHGYNRLFGQRVNEIVDEFGERGIRHRNLAKELDPNRQINGDGFYRLVMSYLGELSDLPEAAN